MARRFGVALGTAVVAASTILVVTALAVILFLNPVWVSFEQGRADVTGWTGWTGDEVAVATGSILHDLVLGPPDFTATVVGQPLLDARERQHMRDVRNVFAGLGLAALAAAAVLVLAWLTARRRPWFWRAVTAGAGVLAVGVVALGAFFGLAFDTAFELFHRIFFGPGTYSFDPRTEHLVQLFPDQFWFETSLALGAVLFALALLILIAGRGRTRRAVEEAATDR